MAGSLLTHKLAEFPSEIIPRRKPLTWEGGNISASDYYVIATQKLVNNNPFHIGNFNDHIEQQLIIIPIEEEYDVIGHADSICRFLDNNTVALPRYDNETYQDEIDYINRVERTIKQQAPELNVIRIESFLSEKQNLEGIYSAEGCYINYLRLGNNIYVPQYNELEDDEVLSTLKKHFRSKEVNIIPVKSCNSLAYLGGVLNCFSHVTY